MSNVTASPVEEFKKSWHSGMESLLKACQIYVKAIDEDVSAKERFKDALPKINAGSWALIENVGRGYTYHALLFDTSSSSDKIIKLPFSEQQKAYECGVEILTDKGDILKVKTEDLTPILQKQVFAKGHIRDIPAQKAYIESKKIERHIEDETISHDWKIIGKGRGKMIKTQKRAYSKHEIEQMLKDISGE